MGTTRQGIDIAIGVQAQQAVSALGVVQGFVQGIGMAVANYAGRAARALAEMTGQALHTADEMGKVAQKAGTTAEKLSAIAYAAKLSDVSLGTLQVGFKGLSDWMEKHGQLGRDMVEVFLEQADAFARLEDGAAKTNLAMDLFGRSGQELIPLLNQGAESIRRQMEEAKRFGLVVSGETARAAEAFNDRLTTMKSRLEGVGLQIADSVLPGLLKMTDVMSAASDKTVMLLTAAKVWFRIQMDIIADAVWMLAAGGTAVGEATVEFGKAVLAGNSLAEIFQRTFGAGAKALADFKQATEDYAKARASAEEGDKKAVTGTQEMASAVEMLRLRFEQLGVTQADLSPEKQLDRIGERLAILKEMQSAIGNPEMIDGAYTEADLKRAEALLDISREQADLNRQRLELMDRLHKPGLEEQFLTRFRENFKALGTVMQQAADIASNTIGAAMHGLAGALTEVIMGTKSAGEAFAQFGLSLLTNFIANVLEMVLVAKVAIPILTTLGVLSGGSTAAVGAGVVMSSLGVAGAFAMRFADGGYVQGPGTSTSDSIVARLSTGEFVMNADATEAIGSERLAAANNGNLDALSDSNGKAPVINIANFGGEAAAKRWAESTEGQVWFNDQLRNQISRYL